MRRPMRASPITVTEQDWSDFAQAGDTEPEIPVLVDLSEDEVNQDEIETLRLIEAAPESDADIEDAIDSCTNPARRSPYPPVKADDTEAA